MSDQQALDPLTAMFMQNPPKDALEFRSMLDAFALADIGAWRSASQKPGTSW